MLIQSKNNKNAHLTVKQRKYPSFPTKTLHSRALLKGKILDFGCGLGVDVDFLRKKRYNITAYDPHYFPNYPKEQFDTIICNYVLNVLLPEEQATVLMAVSELLKPTGKAYFTVRRDIQKDGFRLHYKHKVQVYQCTVKLPYKSILKAKHCEIYEYQHYNQVTAQNTDCPFCNLSKETKILTETATAFAILHPTPTNQFHALIIPKRHKINYFDLTFKEQKACWFMVNRVQKLLQKQHPINSFNININVGKSPKQSISHTHIHLIPHYQKL